MWFRGMLRQPILRERQPADLILVLSCFLSLYYLYYGILRSRTNEWNQREAHIEDINWEQNEWHSRLHHLAVDPSISGDITVVSAFFDIGNFQKGRHSHFTPGHYSRWMEFISRLDNKLILFTDSKEVLEKAAILRSGHHGDRTVLRLVSKHDLNSFKMAPKIKEIFEQTDYPRHHPNTVNENYSACMHSKYELLSMAIESNLTDTRYLAWMDLGLFRNNLWESTSILLQLPDGFDSHKIGYNEVKRRDGEDDLTVESIVRDNRVWVGGGLFVGRIDLMYVHCEDYLRSAEEMMRMKWMSTDQQVVYSMYTDKFPIPPRTQVQVFSSNSGDDWYFMAHTMKDIKDKATREMKRLADYSFYYV